MPGWKSPRELYFMAISEQQEVPHSVDTSKM